MFNISWGETLVLTGAVIAVVGRKDLPNMCRYLGLYVGRFVGLLQGARARADRFAAQSELRQLQNELRMGLRELDVVRSEVAITMSSQSMKGLGATVPGVNRQSNILPTNPKQLSTTTTSVSEIGNTHLVRSFIPPAGGELAESQPKENVAYVRELAPRSQAVAAVAEEEWLKRGIGFRTKVERGSGEATGSALLSNLYQQTLIFDQHDRVVLEQDEILRARVKKIEEQYKPKS
jgi:Sec-independent protein translocase protein TatA